MVDAVALARDLDFYNAATVVARDSDYTTRVGCIAAKGAKKICSAANAVRNHAMNVSFGEATYHAEMNVLRMLPRTDRVTLYIARLGKLYQSLPSRPCNRCMERIRDSGIKEIVYLDKYNRVVKELL